MSNGGFFQRHPTVITGLIILLALVALGLSIGAFATKCNFKDGFGQQTCIECVTERCDDCNNCCVQKSASKGICGDCKSKGCSGQCDVPQVCCSDDDCSGIVLDNCDGANCSQGIKGKCI